MTTPKPLRMGIIGCGGISHVHAGAAAAIPNIVQFVACCDVREESAQEWATKYGAKTHYTDFLRMVSEQQLDAVLLATWPNQHREQVEQLLKAGVKNILCEKALSLTGREAVEMFHLARDARAFMMEGFMYRHHPAIRRMEAVVASGELGQVDSVRAVFSALMEETLPAGDPNLGWRQRKDCGGGVPYDFTCYPVNACNHFAGPGSIPRVVRAFGSVSARYGTIDRLNAIIRYDSGGTAVVESSHHAAENQELQINLARGTLYLPISWTINDAVNLERREPVRWSVQKREQELIPKTNAYQLQLENFAAAVRGTAKPLMTLRESIINTFTIEAMVRSMQDDRDVEIMVPDEVLKAEATR